jgi:hypothetical protein
VTFFDGGTAVGSAPLSGSTPDVATMSTSAIALETRHITARYSGDPTHAASALSFPVTVQVTSVGPVISAVSPVAGSTAGGSTVTITGTGFTGATAVAFGNGAPAVAFEVNAAGTQITATSPAHAAGTVNLKVTTHAGSSATVAADQFTFEGIPTVTSVVPSSGPLAGGTSVAIHGTGFTGASAVVFGNGVPAAGFTVNTAGTVITATSPAHAAGGANIKVTTPVGTSTVVAADLFTFTAALPVITAVAPKSGLVAGGDTVTIIGTGFTGTSKVLFGNGAPAVTFEVNPAGTQITVLSPAHAAGAVNMRVTTPAGTSAVVTADQFTFKPPAPTITSVSPASGPTAGGTTVTITGTGFTGATAVLFGNGAPATGFTVSPDGTTITVNSPAHAAGAVNIKVTTPSGASATVTADQYKYLAP